MASWSSFLSYLWNNYNPNMSIDMLVEPLNPGAKWSNSRSMHLTAMSSSWLCFTLTQASRWRHMLPPSPSRSPIPKNCRPSGLEAQTTKPHREAYLLSMISTCATIMLDCLITKSSCVSTWLDQSPSWLGQHGLLLTHVQLLVDVPMCQPSMVSLPATLILGPSLMFVLYHF